MRSEQSEKPPAALLAFGGTRKCDKAFARAFWSIVRRTCACSFSMPKLTGSMACFITHEHADHTHGIDDLRPLFVHKRRRVDVYLDEPTSRAMHARFGYCFMTPPGSEYPPIVTEKRLVAGQNRSLSRGREDRSRRCRSCRTTATSPRSASASAMWPTRPTSRTCRPKASRRCAARRLDRGRVAQDAASEPFQSRRGAGMDRPDQAETGDPDQSCIPTWITRHLRAICRPRSSRPTTG